MRPTLKRLRWPTALLVSGTSLGPWAMRGASSTTQTGSRNQLWTVVMIDLGGGLGIESTELEEHDAPFGEIEPEGSFDDHSIVVSLDCQHRPDQCCTQSGYTSRPCSHNHHPVRLRAVR